MSDNDSVSDESGDDDNPSPDKMGDGSGAEVEEDDFADGGGIVLTDRTSDDEAIDDRNSNVQKEEGNKKGTGAPRRRTLLDEDDDEDDDDVRIVGKKRKALHDKYDPKKARKRKMRDYYGNGTPLIINLTFATFAVTI